MSFSHDRYEPQTRMQRLGYRKSVDVVEPDQLVLVEFVSDGRVAIVTLNRPHADNAITTELAAQLIDMLETIAARSSVRVTILTGAGDRAFSVGGDLYQRAVQMGQGEPVEQASAIMMDEHWRSVVSSRPGRGNQGLHRRPGADVSGFRFLRCDRVG